MCLLYTFKGSVIAESCSSFTLRMSWVSSHSGLWGPFSGRQSWWPGRAAMGKERLSSGAFPTLWHVWAKPSMLEEASVMLVEAPQSVDAGSVCLCRCYPTLAWHKMPFNGEKQCVGEDQPSDSDSSRFSESMASLSDSECSRQSFTSDSSSKSSSPACKLTGSRG